ncbi:MAG: hypothetical protein ACRD82_05600, partial [Blastocatellia bacterium]
SPKLSSLGIEKLRASVLDSRAVTFKFGVGFFGLILGSEISGSRLNSALASLLAFGVVSFTKANLLGSVFDCRPDDVDEEAFVT